MLLLEQIVSFEFPIFKGLHCQGRQTLNHKKLFPFAKMVKIDGEVPIHLKLRMSCLGGVSLYF